MTDKDQKNPKKPRRSLFSLRPFGRRKKAAATGAAPADDSADGSAPEDAKPAVDFWEDEARMPRMRLRIIELPPLADPGEEEPGGMSDIAEDDSESGPDASGVAERDTGDDSRRSAHGRPQAQPDSGDDALEDLLAEIDLVRRQVADLQAVHRHAGEEPARDGGNDAGQPSPDDEIDEIRERLSALREALNEIDTDPPTRG